MLWEYKCQQQSWQQVWSRQIGPLSNNWNETWWGQKWLHGNHQLPWHKNISYHIKQTFFILWTNIWWSHQMSTHRITWKIFTCITINQSFVLHEPWMWHSTSTSKIMGYHPVHILTIPTNKKYLTSIQIIQSRILKSILICSPNGNPSKFSHRTINNSQNPLGSTF